MTSATDIQTLAADLSLAIVRLTRHLRGRRVNSSVSLTQLSALATLAREGPITPGALAAKERVQPPSMTRVIASLAELGLVDRAPHPTDGRQVIVSLAESGKDLIATEATARRAWMTDRVATLDAEQREVLRKAVEILGQIVDEPEP
ncbi:MarR family transcriptional regulator [Aldersonia sp. NBC_00410]|uniref:MarR family winged helix-turn-helix transcriptional regulator n=1 Tax=Aldersonia sp. NBC_00410 TaxID=2975954 RepID=UPI0022506B38|nr:MarR family transcriptional regulator [Aldersonia sp. NBC_00410]MCX5045692.1 MarR family transcriptional regulator [Aldersonia sp. NBC_00410]